MMLRIPVCYHSDKTKADDLANKKYPLSDCKITPMTFLKVDAIAPYWDSLQDDKEYSLIILGTEEFTVNLTYSELQSRLEIALKGKY